MTVTNLSSHMHTRPTFLFYLIRRVCMHDFSPVWTGILQAPGENMFVAIHVKENLVASRHIDQE